MKARLLSIRVIAPAVAVLAMWAVLVWWPMRSDTADATQRREELEIAQLATATEIASLQQAGETTGRYEDDVVRFAEMVPPELDLPAVLRRFDELATASGFQIELVSPAALGDDDSMGPILPSGVTSLSMTIAGAGSYPSAIRFLEAVDRDPRLVVFDSVSFTSTNDGVDQIVVDLECRIFTTGPVGVSGVDSS